MMDELQVAVDVGSRRPRVASGIADGRVLEEFDMAHTPEGLGLFFRRVEERRREVGGGVNVAMEGLNGWARPLDGQILMRGWRLYNVNNLKLARFKEIFPGASKSDAIDARKMLELFGLRERLPLAKGVLQEVAPIPAVEAKLKRLTRRRRQLVEERVRVVNRLHADLQAVSPGLLEITGQVSNLWFLRFLSVRDDLRQLSRLRVGTLRQIRGVGAKYAAVIQAWQKRAQFAEEVEWVGSMIIEDARRTLALIKQIAALEDQIEQLVSTSTMAQRIDSIPGFGPLSSGELAGEIGTPGRFGREAGLALYLGVTSLEHSSGQYRGSRPARNVNRRAQASIITATVRHMACVSESRAYYDKKRTEGKSHRQAVRALARHLVRVIWSMLKHDRDYQTRT